FVGMTGLFRKSPPTRSAASRTASRRSPCSALRTTRKPSRSNVSRSSAVSLTKSMASLPDHTAVLHLAVHRWPDLGVREQRLHRVLRVEGVVRPLLLGRIVADAVVLDVEVVAVDEDAPRRGVGARAQGLRFVAPGVALPALEAPGVVVPVVAPRPAVGGG